MSASCPTRDRASLHPSRHRTRAVLVAVAVLATAPVQVVTAPGATAAVPSIVVRDASAAEDAGRVTVRVRLSRPAPVRTTVSYTTLDRTASAGADYVATRGTVVLRQGTRSRAVRVRILDDAVDEGDETFRVRLSHPSRGRLADRTAAVVIREDDPLPGLSMTDVEEPEGDVVQGPLNVPVLLSAPSARAVSVDYTVRPGTATPGTDYAGPTSGTLEIPVGQTRGQIPLRVVGDTVDETSETLVVTLADPVHAVLTDGTAVARILDDDGPGLRIEDARIAEGGTLSFTVALSAASPQVVRVGYATANGSAVAGSDYADTSGTMVLDPGVTSRVATVRTFEDSVDERDETLVLRLGTPVDATLVDAVATATIDDDDGPQADVGDPLAVVEGVGTLFTVSLSAASPQEVRVDYRTVDGTAVAPGDYASRSGTLTFAAGQTSRTVAVSTVADAVAEEDEYLSLQVLAPVDATIGDGSGYLFLNGNPSIAAATPLGTIRGDVGSDTLTRDDLVVPQDTDFYRVVVDESRRAVTDDPMSVTVVLQVLDSGRNLDLCVLGADGSVLGCSSSPGTTEERLHVGWADGLGDDTRTLYAQVFGGGVTSYYTLRVTR